MNDFYRQLKEFGFSNNTIYGVGATDNFRDYVDECDYGYYDSERFYDESGRSTKKGGTYTLARFVGEWAA